jgi:hypothetical protein
MMKDRREDAKVLVLTTLHLIFFSVAFPEKPIEK